MNFFDDAVAENLWCCVLIGFGFCNQANKHYFMKKYPKKHLPAQRQQKKH